MKRIGIAAFLPVLALSACGVARQAEVNDAQQRLEAARAFCKAYHKGNGAQIADCWSQAEDMIMRPLYPYGDLLTLLQAKRKVIAEKADGGEITKDQANLQLAELNSEITREQTRRSNAAALVSAQQTAASAAMLGTAARLLQGTQPAPVMGPLVVNTTCTRMGAFVNCSSN